MKPGVTLRQASAEMAGIAAHLAKAYPNENRGWATRVMDIREKIAGNLVGGYQTEGLDAQAGPASSVLEAQMTRLKRYIESGNPG